MSVQRHSSLYRRTELSVHYVQQLWLIWSSLTLEAAKTLLHVFISSCLDYCNSLLYSIRNGLLKKLQTVQSSAAHVVAGARKFNHITAVLHDLWWLPFRQRILFELATIVLKCLHGLAPSYLADDCILVWSKSSVSVLGWHHKIVGTANKNSHRHQSFRSVHCCHLEQSTSRAQTDVVHPDIRMEAQNFSHQLNNVTAAHLRTV